MVDTTAVGGGRAAVVTTRLVGRRFLLLAQIPIPIQHTLETNTRVIITAPAIIPATEETNTHENVIVCSECFNAQSFCRSLCTLLYEILVAAHWMAILIDKQQAKLIFLPEVETLLGVPEVGVVPDDARKSQVVFCVLDDAPDAYSVVNTQTQCLCTYTSQTIQHVIHQFCNVLITRKQLLVSTST